MSYKLMIKTHNKTHLKYLCITKREKWEEYTGSGVKWHKHLIKNGFDISTELLFETEDYESFLIQCLYYSNLYNVVLSEEWANMIPESGYSKTMFVDFWTYTSDEVKQDIYKRRASSLKETYKLQGGHSDLTKQKISEAHIKNWNNLNLKQRRELTNKFREGMQKLVEEKGEKYNIWVKNLKKSSRKYHDSVDKSFISQKISKMRLNMSEESKVRRKEKIKEIYSSGKHDALFKKYSEERKGKNNPNAKIYTWMGIEYIAKDFRKFIIENKLSKKTIEYEFKNNKTCSKPSKPERNNITCPVCLKEGKDSPAFRRWHFDNCKGLK